MTLAGRQVEYAGFDLHTLSAHSKKSKWALAQLAKTLKLSVEKHHIFGVDGGAVFFCVMVTPLAAEAKVMTCQKGIHRVNCLDSLDRTNIVQMHIRCRDTCSV